LSFTITFINWIIAIEAFSEENQQCSERRFYIQGKNGNEIFEIFKKESSTKMKNNAKISGTTKILFNYPI
jgi:hypothetical protein